ncbi:c-type cytochrome [Blastomonas sp. SL216]|uniref:c-type cytochrome n=1 Tax=Blastomonas sp. SL216 TaxID=2995169 RepID=UPI00237744AC|nr:c-type cytochrome [Blastomonas sp. SL216]
MRLRSVMPLLLALIPGAAVAQAGNPSGERAFQRCYSCHSIKKEEKGLSGPNLDRLGQRPLAGDKTFAYSRAFKDFAAHNRRWTAELLDRFLTDPQAVVPGNQMGFFGLRKAEEREAIIVYLMADN